VRAYAFLGLVVAVACGGESNQDLFDDPKRGGSGASAGSSGKGGAAGKGSGGSTGGTGTGGATGGTGTGGSATGGTGGATGGIGTGGATGGGGTGGTTGGAGTGGTEHGGSGGDAGSGAGTGPAAGVGGGPAGSSGAGGRGSGGAGGRAGGGGSAGGMTCDQMQAAYGEALQQARECNPAIDAEQCTALTSSGIVCGCPVAINPAHEEAVAELLRLHNAFSQMGCEVACPDIACIGPYAGTCQPADSVAGLCLTTTASK
jgi:hypothetical protein